ncbi:MAG: hypothetical protein MUO21_10020, partial [Nitrososphaeraceae archaeon]|nr:hypothetical protein [Nitrososphaeraceae archaeon]
MKKGKSNNFKDISKISEKLDCYNKIHWNASLPKEKKVSMDDLLSYIQSNNVEMINHLKVGIDDYKNFKILGYCTCSMNEYLEYIYLLTDEEFKTLYVSIGRCHPLFWYKFTTKKDFLSSFDELYNAYSKSEINFEFIKTKRVFIGNDDLLDVDIHDIENHLILHKYTDKLIYGSLWGDHPFRTEYTNKVVDPINSIIFTGQAMRQEENEPYRVSVRSQYSKSLLTIYNFDGTF